MALPNYITKTLYMKPEVSQIFEDLEAWHDYCRFNLLPFVPSDLYKSKEYKEWQWGNKKYDRRYKKDTRAVKPAGV